MKMENAYLLLIKRRESRKWISRIASNGKRKLSALMIGTARTMQRNGEKI